MNTFEQHCKNVFFFLTRGMAYEVTDLWIYVSSVNGIIERLI